MDKILHFLATQKLAVISTINNMMLEPESALVAFVETEDLCIYFQTGKHTRKAKNLATNPRVSFVFGLSLQDMITVQYEGITELVKTQELAFCHSLFRAKNSPTTHKYLNHPSAVVYKVKPTWIGCSDYSGHCPEITELKDFSAA